MLRFNTDVAAESLDYTQQVALEGKTYTFRYAWNTRDEYWSLACTTAEGEIIFAGRPIVLGVDFLARSRSANKPPGTLVAIADDDQRVRPGLYELGSRVGLYYVAADETL